MADKFDALEEKIDTLIAQQEEFLTILRALKEQTGPVIETLTNHPMAKMFLR